MILVTGATGFVGHKIIEMCKNTVAAPSLRNVTEDEVRRIVEECGADTIVHTAAISDIGTCEKDPEACYIANVQLPVYLAKAAQGRKLVCFSSDQVYSGLDERMDLEACSASEKKAESDSEKKAESDSEKKAESDSEKKAGDDLKKQQELQHGPFTEDTVKPANIYAEHKLEMEQRVLDICPDAVMLRAEWMYDHYTQRSNYYMNILNSTDHVAFSSKQYRGITYVKEVAENIEKVIKLPGGAYNFGSETTKSMYEITKEFVEALGLNLRVEDAPARRNLWMDCSKARKYGVEFSEVSAGLIRCARDNGADKTIVIPDC